MQDPLQSLLMPDHRSSEPALIPSSVSNDDAAVVTDLTGAIIDWNDAAGRLFGYTASEAVGRSIRLLIPSARQTEEDDVASRVRNGETINRFETIGRCKDGRLVPIAFTVAAIRAADGDIVGARRVAHDLSGRRRLEPGTLRLAAIIESSDDAIVGKDLDGIVFSWNRAAERIFGYTAEEMIGRPIRLIVPADRQSEEDEVLARIRRGERVDHFETMRRRKDGTLVPISLTVSPIRDADGVVVGASKIARDVTE